MTDAILALIKCDCNREFRFFPRRFRQSFGPVFVQFDALAKCYPGVVSWGPEVIRVAKLTEKKRASNKRWDDANLARMSLALPKDLAERMKERANNIGMSVNGYIRQLVERDLE